MRSKDRRYSAMKKFALLMALSTSLLFLNAPSQASMVMSGHWSDHGDQHDFLRGLHAQKHRLLHTKLEQIHDNLDQFIARVVANNPLLRMWLQNNEPTDFQALLHDRFEALWELDARWHALHDDTAYNPNDGLPQNDAAVVPAPAALYLFLSATLGLATLRNRLRSPSNRRLLHSS